MEPGGEEERVPESEVVSNNVLVQSLCLKVIQEGGSDEVSRVVEEPEAERVANMARTSTAEYIADGIIERLPGMIDADKATIRASIDNALDVAKEAGGSITPDTVKALLEVVEALGSA